MKRYAALARDRRARLAQRRSRAASRSSSTASSVARGPARARSSAPRPEDAADHGRPLEQRASRRAAAGRCARRSAPGACPGSARGRRRPPPTSIRIVSSTKSGLPSVLSSSVVADVAGSDRVARAARRRAPRCRRGRAARARSRSRGRGRRPSRDARRAARAARGRGSGAARRAPARRGARSARAAAPRPSGCPRRRARAAARRRARSAHSRAAHAISCWLRSPSTASSTPAARPSRSATASSSQQARSFSTRLLDGIVVGDPGRGLHHLGERPVRDALAVGEAAAGEHGRALEARDELAREPALADARLAVDREQVRAAVAHGALERVLEQLELVLAADERRRQRRDGRPPRRGTPTARQTGSGVAEAAQLARARGLELDRADGEPVRAGADEDLARRGRLLQARGDVDRLAGREASTRASSATTSPASTPMRASRPSSRTESRIASAARTRALGVVLVRARDAERGHDGVAGELLDGAAVRVDAARDAARRSASRAGGRPPDRARRRARSSRRGRRRGRLRACAPRLEV